MVILREKKWPDIVNCTKNFTNLQKIPSSCNIARLSPQIHVYLNIFKAIVGKLKLTQNFNEDPQMPETYSILKKINTTHLEVCPTFAEECPMSVSVWHVSNKATTP